MSASTENYFIIGVDEAGRGPLAGPVVVGAVKCGKTSLHVLRGIKDSKKLTPKQREEWFLKLTKHPDIAWSAVKISHKTIDKINIFQATNLGAWKAYKKLAGKTLCKALLDGSLKLPPHVPQRTIIKGDEKIPVISAASIIAKVTRDRLMIRLHKKYPKYRFDLHKGYPTKMHRNLVLQYGRSRVHRKSFAKNLQS